MVGPRPARPGSERAGGGFYGDRAIIALDQIVDTHHDGHRRGLLEGLRHFAHRGSIVVDLAAGHSSADPRGGERPRAFKVSMASAGSQGMHHRARAHGAPIASMMLLWPAFMAATTAELNWALAGGLAQCSLGVP